MLMQIIINVVLVASVFGKMNLQSSTASKAVAVQNIEFYFTYFPSAIQQKSLAR